MDSSVKKYNPLTIQQTVQNSLIARALMSMPNITFDKRSTRKFGDWDPSLGPDT